MGDELSKRKEKKAVTVPEDSSGVFGDNDSLSLIILGMAPPELVLRTLQLVFKSSNEVMKNAILNSIFLGDAGFRGEDFLKPASDAEPLDEDDEVEIAEFRAFLDDLPTGDAPHDELDDE